MSIHQQGQEIPAKSAYAQAGVDLAEGNRATSLMAQAVRSTFGPEVLSDMGAFGGLYSAAALQKMTAPVLVASTDGVGTKTKVAVKLGRWDTIGQDIVNHCVNDILVQGARPLFFLDYVASSRLDATQIATIVAGIATACRAVNCALLGGETAEMPGVYEAGEIDLVGTVVGVVEQGRLIDGRSIAAGDVILGLPSVGLHTNGFSLARRALSDVDWTTHQPTLGQSIGDALLVPHRCYLPEVQALWQAGVTIRGLAHITGGGLIDNPPRIFPHGLGAIIRRGTWPELPIFGLIAQLGQVTAVEMCHVFNMGLGMLLVVPPDQVALAQQTLGAEVYVVGEMITGERKVTILEKE